MKKLIQDVVHLNIRVINTVWWTVSSFLYFTLFYSFPLFAQVKMSDFMGANIKREDPVEALNCVGFAREFHDWVIDEGNAYQQGASPLYPNNVCAWNPGYQFQTFEKFHEFYPRVSASLSPSNPTGVPICVTMTTTLPSIVQEVCNSNWIPTPEEAAAVSEYKPLYPGGFARTDPRSYEYYADWLTQFGLHFGGSPNTTIYDKQPNEPKPQDAIIGYIEAWNEPDKTAAWYAADGQCPDLIGFTKDEYVALAKTAYDGNGNSILGDEPGTPDSYMLGVSRFPNVKMVMAGLSDFDDDNISYADAILAGQSGLDVVNFHHYCDGVWPGVGTIGISPEADAGMVAGQTRTFKQALRYLHLDKYPDKELWLSEFGWDTNENSPQRAPKIPANNLSGGINEEADNQEVQGCWIVRGYLETRAAGWDKAMVFFLRDDSSLPEAGLFQSSGLLRACSKS